MAGPVYNWGCSAELKRFVEFVGTTPPDGTRSRRFLRQDRDVHRLCRATAQLHGNHAHHGIDDAGQMHHQSASRIRARPALGCRPNQRRCFATHRAICGRPGGIDAGASAQSLRLLLGRVGSKVIPLSPICHASPPPPPSVIPTIGPTPSQRSVNSVHPRPRPGTTPFACDGHRADSDVCRPPRSERVAVLDGLR